MVLCSWSSDGTENGTVQVGEIYPGSEDSDMRYLTPAAGALLFRANDGSSGPELWSSDGTPFGTQRVTCCRPS